MDRRTRVLAAAARDADMAKKKEGERERKKKTEKANGGTLWLIWPHS
jgi:hypothetical protein